MQQDALTNRPIPASPTAATAAVAERSIQARPDTRTPPVPPPAAPAAAAAAHEEPPRSLQAVAEQIETYLRANGRELRFSVDAESGRTVITVRDPESGAVVRQIPSEEALRLARSLGDRPGAILDLQA